MRVRFHSEAKAEYRAAAHYYRSLDLSLADQFIERIGKGVETIERQPFLCPLAELDVRRYLVKQFPFGILYTVEQDEIVIWAVMHLNRKPGYWKERRS